nr:PREDICTED: mucin-15 [Rhinolophus sinicus]
MMLTSAQTLFISTLFNLLLLGSHGEEGLEVKTTQNIVEDLKTMANGHVSLESATNLRSNQEDRETSNPRASNSSLQDSSNKTNGTTDFISNLPTDFPRSPRPTSTFPTSPPLINSSVSNLPQNSSVADGNPVSVSAPPNATSAVSTENFTWSSANDTMKTTDNSSLTGGTPPSAPTTIPVNPMTTEPDGWLTTTGDTLGGFTPYQETTPQPTLKFTNNSKIFPNTSDPQEENRNTGVVFGAILGAILGASLLSLVGYLLCGKRKTNSFSHRRLYDDRNEPVLRLDNVPEPYDVSFGNSSYYSSNVNDSSMAAGRENARDGIPMDNIPPLRTSI